MNKMTQQKLDKINELRLQGKHYLQIRDELGISTTTIAKAKKCNYELQKFSPPKVFKPRGPYKSKYTKMQAKAKELGFPHVAAYVHHIRNAS
jgi:hypothetical protein